LFSSHKEDIPENRRTLSLLMDKVRFLEFISNTSFAPVINDVSFSNHKKEIPINGRTISLLMNTVRFLELILVFKYF
jgi:hypothetical protein